MVYCTKCGTENDEEATECSNCGKSLKPEPYRYRRTDWEMDEYFHWKGKKSWSMIFGLFLILMGLSSLLEDVFWWASFDVLWPVFIIGIGLVIVNNSFRRR